MSDEKGSRRAMAELRWESGAEPVERVGGRSLHQYWPVLSPYFRDVLLAPSRRPGEDAVSWTWREPDGARAVTAAELRGLRKRLTGEQELLAENLARAEAAGGDAVGQRRGGSIQGLAAAMGHVIERLVAASDAELAGYVARTEGGLRLHSWGAAAPACVNYPDTPVAGNARERTVAREERTQSGGRRRRRAAWVVLGSVSAVVVVGGGFWAGAERWARAERPGEMPTAGAAAQEGGATPEGSVGGRSRGGDLTQARMGGRATAEGAAGGDRASERAAQTPNDAASVVSRRVAQKAVQGEEVRGLPLTPNGRPEPEKPAADGRPGGVLRERDSGKMPEKRADVGSVIDETVERKSVAEVERDRAVARRVEVTEPAAVRALEERKLAGERRPDEDAEERETRVRERDDRTKDFGGSGDVVEVVGSGGESGALREGGWQREVRVRMLRWHTRMLADVIVPTRPVRLGEAGAVENLRERTLSEARARMPATLRELRWRGGVGVEIGAGGDFSQWRWRRRGVGSGTGVRAVLREGRAELQFVEGRRTEIGVWRLEHAELGVMAEVRVEGEEEGERDVWVFAREGVRVYQWFAVGLALEERGERWSWRRVATAGLPEGVRVPRGSDAAETRVEVPIVGTAGVDTPVEPVAFFDGETGWAAVGER